MKIDKSQLPEHLVEKQKAKGTYDSPCMSICNYAGEEFICQTCMMMKSEKQVWKTADQKTKDELLKKIFSRKK